MNTDYKTATVFGGTGFLGRQVVRGLAKRGIVVKVASRVPERAYFLRTAGVVGQIVPFACNYHDPASIENAVRGSDYVVNCVGTLFEKGKRRTFKNAHVDVPAAIAQACAKHNVERLVHVSSLGVDQAQSEYAKSKFIGEDAVFRHFPQAVILRPSVMFGEDDDLFNRFAKMAQICPVMPLIGGGHTKFQLVYVADVADAAIAGLTLSGEHDPRGKIFELGGPEVVTFRGIYQRLFRYMNLKRKLVTLPFGVAKMQARVMQLLPVPPLTPDQVETLKTDNVVTEGALTLADLGVRPTSMDLILPAYLETYRAGGRFAGQKAA